MNMNDMNNNVNKKFLWIGRDIPLKNLKKLELAFALAKERAPGISLEICKNLPQDKVWEKLKSCYAFILPSISEVSPNLVLQALKFGRPVIMTRESGYSDWLRDIVRLVNPLDTQDIAKAIIELSDENVQRDYRAKIKNFTYVHTYQDIAREFLEVYKSL